MGRAAASVIAAEIRRAIQERGKASIILASAPSQNEFLASLAEAPDIDWSRVTAFHLDEYLGMDDQAPQSFRRFLIDRLVNKVPLGQFHGLRGDAEDGTPKQSAMQNYSNRIRPISPCSESERTAISLSSIPHSATSTIPNP
jgi:6-phosphogluconolactonase/glucosamine-6-phosphate isomerase/deaminase